jgi:hypothetical protein
VWRVLKGFPSAFETDGRAELHSTESKCQHYRTTNYGLHAPSEPGIWLHVTTAKPSGDGGGDDGPRGLRRVDVGQRMLRGCKRQLSPAADKPSHTPWAALCQD